LYFENHTNLIYKIGGKIQRLCVLRERERDRDGQTDKQTERERDRSEMCHLLRFFLDLLALEDKADSFSRNVGTELPLHAT
jgi:hypothetical protein